MVAVQDAPAAVGLRRLLPAEAQDVAAGVGLELLARDALLLLPGDTPSTTADSLTRSCISTRADSIAGTSIGWYLKDNRQVCSISKHLTV